LLAFNDLQNKFHYINNNNQELNFKDIKKGDYVINIQEKPQSVKKQKKLVN